MRLDECEKMHTNQVKKLKSQIDMFSRDNFAEYLISDELIESNTCTPNFIDFADSDAVAELKSYVDFLHDKLQDYDLKVWVTLYCDLH